MKNAKTILFVLFVFCFLAVACGAVDDDVINQEVTMTAESFLLTPSSTVTPSPTLSPTNTSTATITVTPRATNTPAPTSTPVYSDPELGYPYFLGEELVDVLALSKARCIQSLYSDFPDYINLVMEEEGLEHIEAVNHICEMPVTTCESIPNPYVKIPILNLGEVWEEGLSESRFSYMYENVPTDEFVPGEQYCFYGLDLKLLSEPRMDRNSLCPDPSWNGVGIPSQDSACTLAVIAVPYEAKNIIQYSGRFSGEFYILDGVSSEWWEDILTDTFAGTVGFRNKESYELPTVADRFSDPGDWIVLFGVTDFPFLYDLNWTPYSGLSFVE